MAEASVQDLFCFSAAVCCQLLLKSARADISPQSRRNGVVLQCVTLQAESLLKYAQRASLMKAHVGCLSERAQQEQDMIVPFTPNILTPNLISFKCLFMSFYVVLSRSNTFDVWVLNFFPDWWRALFFTVTRRFSTSEAESKHKGWVITVDTQTWYTYF